MPTQDNLDYQPVIIIGSARSGTNMLRDCLIRIKGFGTWPCDEINLIWRHGNRNFASDEFTRKQVNNKARKYIRAAFDKLARKQNLDFVVEKTCANSLRVDFVDELFPKAKYIFIVRDGRDATSSAMKRWKAPIELPYLLKKLRYVPISDVPAYGVRFVKNRFNQLRSADKRQAYWGPRVAALEKKAANYSIAEICASQWVETTKASSQAFESFDSNRVIRITYEEFLQAPQSQMGDILSFLQCKTPIEEIKKSVADVRPPSTVDWKAQLSIPEQQQIAQICQPMLKKFGYVS